MHVIRNLSALLREWGTFLTGLKSNVTGRRAVSDRLRWYCSTSDQPSSKGETHEYLVYKALCKQNEPVGTPSHSIIRQNFFCISVVGSATPSTLLHVDGYSCTEATSASINTRRRPLQDTSTSPFDVDIYSACRRCILRRVAPSYALRPVIYTYQTRGPHLINIDHGPLAGGFNKTSQVVTLAVQTPMLLPCKLSYSYRVNYHTHTV